VQFYCFIRYIPVAMGSIIKSAIPNPQSEIRGLALKLTLPENGHQQPDSHDGRRRKEQDADK
jgi:hypothetical protein